MKESHSSGAGPTREETIDHLCRLFNERAGLFYEGGARAALKRKLISLISERGISSLEEYSRILERDPRELKIAFERITTKETYFFRQEYQLRAFADELLPRIVKEVEGQRHLTIWCAGCSSGEESYTIAMLLLESELFRDWRLRVVGTDLCSSNIETAQKGIYRQNSFRSTSQSLKDKYFTEVEGGFQVSRELRGMVHFSVGNLMDVSEVRTVGRVDAIFCRNVLIYFDARSRRKVTELFFERLLPGAYLLLGHSESLLNSKTDFEAVHLEEDLVYRRPQLGLGPRNTRASL